MATLFEYAIWRREWEKVLQSMVEIREGEFNMESLVLIMLIVKNDGTTCLNLSEIK